MILLAIDPGPAESAWLLFETGNGRPLAWRKQPNEEIATWLREVNHRAHRPDACAVEMVASYGMAVGAEVFETCVWVGRFWEAWLRRDSRRCGGLGSHRLVYRRQVKLHLCGDSRAKDANIRQALIDRYGGKAKAIGLKASPGPLYGMTGDCWAALGVAITAAETEAS